MHDEATAGLRTRAGSSLLEAMVALAMLGLAGVGMVRRLATTADALRTTIQEEQALRRAREIVDWAAVQDASTLLALAPHASRAGMILELTPERRGVWQLRCLDTEGRVILATALYHESTP